MMRVLQVVPRIAASSSGPSVSVPSLCNALQAASVETRLMALQPEPEQLLFQECEFLPASRFPFAHRLGASGQMKRALHDAARQVQVIHTNSVWMMPNIYPSAAVRGTDCRFVISPRGTLSPWAMRRARLRKAIIWRCGQKDALSRADCIHATSMEELEEARNLGFRQPIAVIPNGVNCPSEVDRTRDGSSTRNLLFLARIHPKKGVDLLLQEWRDLSRAFPDWCLKIAGPLNNVYAGQMKSLADSMGLQRVEFLGEVSGNEKQKVYEQADLYVLPTHSENFGISVAEALAHGVPAIVTRGAPWSGLCTEKAGWWIDHGGPALRDALTAAMGTGDAQRSLMGANGRRWMQGDFEWGAIGRRMADVYRWLVHGDSQPPDVVTD